MKELYLVISNDKVNYRILEALLCERLAGLRVFLVLSYCSTVSLSIVTNSFLGATGSNQYTALITFLNPFFGMVLDKMGSKC
jgi:hypothetical protein